LVDILSSLKVYIPKQELLIKCSNILNGIINKKENNFDEIQSIQKIRDSLLPKLMSGKIRVPVEVE
jgi:type I restriction enzyme S subunit